MLKDKQKERARAQIREARNERRANFRMVSQPKRKREGRDQCEMGINAYFAH